jgi:hypothetical protein
MSGLASTEKMVVWPQNVIREQEIKHIAVSLYIATISESSRQHFEPDDNILQH